MSNYPELDGYVPDDDNSEADQRRRQRRMRRVGLLVLAALLIPSLIASLPIWGDWLAQLLFG